MTFFLASLVFHASGCRQRDGLVSSTRALQTITPDEHSVGSFTLPVHELSGLSVLQDVRDDKKKILAINDADKKLLAIDFENLIGGSLKFDSFDVRMWAGVAKPNGNAKSGSQWEAIASDENGRLYISNEEAAIIEVFDFYGQRMLGQIQLGFNAEDRQFLDLKKSWDEDEASRVEGFAILPNGHILAAKEKNPPALIEFAPEGASAQGFSKALLEAKGKTRPFGRFSLGPGALPKKLNYYARKIWRPSSEFHEDLDLSELVILENGQMVVLSDRMRAVYYIGDSLTVGETTFKPRKTVSLPESMEKPEGLTFMKSDTALIAVDLKEIKPNLFFKQLK